MTTETKHTFHVLGYGNPSKGESAEPRLIVAANGRIARRIYGRGLPSHYSILTTKLSAKKAAELRRIREETGSVPDAI